MHLLGLRLSKYDMQKDYQEEEWIDGCMDEALPDPLQE